MWSKFGSQILFDVHSIILWIKYIWYNIELGHHTQDTCDKVIYVSQRK